MDYSCLSTHLCNAMFMKSININLKYYFILLLLLPFVISFAQDNPVAIGQWRSHLSYESMVALTESDDAVFYASTQGVLKVNKAEQSLEHLNKVSGLSDMGISTLEYNRDENFLVIAYNNGNIDLLYDNGQINNLSAILINSSIVLSYRTSSPFSR